MNIRSETRARKESEVRGSREEKEKRHGRGARVRGVE